MLRSVSKWHEDLINYLSIEVVVVGVSDDGGAVRTCDLCAMASNQEKK